MNELLFTSTVLAAFVGGVLALMAPCCVSVMLPAYFASTFRRRIQIVGMTLVFAAGVATVILPIALGATAISRLLLGQHAWVFGIGGLLMILAGVAMLTGRTFSLPMIGGRASTGGGMRSVYGLGVFSGGASACCAPVLVGVTALAGAAASFPVALTMGVTYVFGMVAPLALIALVWDRRDWGSSRLLGARSVSLLGGRRVPLATVISAGLMVLMGALTSILAVTGQGMATSDWQVETAARLQHLASLTLDALAWVPGWAGAAAVLGSLALLVVVGLRRRRDSADPATPDVPGQPAPDGSCREGASTCTSLDSTSLEKHP